MIGDFTEALTAEPAFCMPGLLDYNGMNWPHSRGLILILHRVREDRRDRGGKRLLDVPGRFQALVTSLPASTHPALRPGATTT